MSPKTAAKIKKPVAKKKIKTAKKKDLPAVELEKEKIVFTQPLKEIEATPEPKDANKSEEKEEKVEKYYEAIGRRKESIARVRVFTRKSTDKQSAENKAIIIVNNKPYTEYFNSEYLQELVDAPLRKLKSLSRFKATVKVNGGGMRGQADAVKHGISRALILFDINFSKKLKKAGYLTRDPREKERRKYGLKKARKAPQWAKR